MFQKKKYSNWKDNTIRAPDTDYYLHVSIETGLKAPTNSIENNTPLDNAWTIVEMCAYQTEVFAWVKNLIDTEKPESKYLQKIKEEEEKLKKTGIPPNILKAKLAYFKMGYILKAYEYSKPDVEAGEIPSSYLDADKKDEGDIEEEEPEPLIDDTKE